MKKFYLTTPIYYINARPHIGHAYTTLAADILNRFRKMRGEETHFLTGTDEHGGKIETAAKAAGKPPRAYADEISGEFKDLWRALDIAYDDFIRTTESRHETCVQAVFRTLHDSKNIYLGKYKGFYCVSDETYWTETDLGALGNNMRGQMSPKDASRGAASTGQRTGSDLLPGVRGDASGDKKNPSCPTCGKPLTWVEEDSYFFALSRYRERLLQHYKAHPGFLQPAHRANEILRFVESELRDLSVSRTKVSWGIPVPFDEKHTIYVWFDALLNYITAAGYNPPGSSLPAEAKSRSNLPAFDELWPADVHLVGKEIYRFHAVIWPAMLMALGLPLPRAVFAHGWWTVEGEKMSKSKGNFIDPQDIAREFGVDALRYFLFREMPFGNDGDFSIQSLRKRYNAELANDLGNLVSRVTQMVDTFLGGELPRRPPLDRPFMSKEVASESNAIYECMERLAFSEALTKIWACVSRLNQNVNKEAPWTLVKSDPEKLRFLLFDLVWSLRIIAGWIAPFMPRTAAVMQADLGVRRPISLTAEEILSGPSDAKIIKRPPLFPRK